MVEKRFYALRTIGTIFNILGALSIIVFLLTAIGICASGVIGGAKLDQYLGQFNQNSGPLGLITGALTGLILAIGPALLAGILSLIFFGIGESIFVILAMEENTRATFNLLGRQGAVPIYVQPNPEPLYQGQTTVGHDLQTPAERTERDDTEKLCPSCGAKISASDKYCLVCGASLTSANQNQGSQSAL